MHMKPSLSLSDTESIVLSFVTLLLQKQVEIVFDTRFLWVKRQGLSVMQLCLVKLIPPVVEHP